MKEISNGKNKTYCGSVNHIDDEYKILVAGILEQAEYDFKKAIIKNNKGKINALKKWFLSDWGQALSGNNGQLIIDRIEYEIKIEREKQ